MLQAAPSELNQFSVRFTLNSGRFSNITVDKTEAFLLVGCSFLLLKTLKTVLCLFFLFQK